MIHGNEIQQQPSRRKRRPRGQRKTTCSKCSEPIESNRLSQSRYCLKCALLVQRIHRKKHSELSDYERKKANARSYLNVYIRRGKISKSPCIVCGDLTVQGHHDDYSKPLEVVWLCQKHHLELHKEIITI